MISIREKSTGVAELARLLREKIKTHEPGEKFGTEVDLAKDLGLSRDSVRKAVEKLVEQGLVERKAGKGLFVAGGCRTVKMVEFIVPAIADHWYAPAINSAQEACRQHGIDMLIRNAHVNLDNEMEIIDQLPKRYADAAIIVSVGNAIFTEKLVALSCTPFPFVVLDQEFAIPTINWLILDFYKAGYQAGQKLVSLGHRRIAVMGDMRRGMPAEALMRGVQDALNDAGLACDRSLFVNIPADSLLVDDKQRYVQAAGALMQQANRPTAFVMSREWYAQMIMDHLMEMGYRIPQDVSFIGYGSDHRHVRFPVPLTCYGPDAAAMGKIAVEMILDQAQQPLVARRKGILLDVVWHTGESIAPVCCERVELTI